VSSEAALWHEVECGGYEADLPLWSELTRRYGGPVLEVGAGSGRVALALAREATSVVALDNDHDLLAELRHRAAAGGLANVETVCGDARSYVAEENFRLIVVAMQTVQLFGGAAGRGRFLACARRNLEPGGCLAVAVADLAPGGGSVPIEYPPDVLTFGDRTYESRPTCVRADGAVLVIERRRALTEADGTLTERTWAQEIDRLGARELEGEARDAGLVPSGRLAVPPTGAYAGSEVVLLHG
jgi:SAM-dependent methyltransferase